MLIFSRSEDTGKCKQTEKKNCLVSANQTPLWNFTYLEYILNSTIIYLLTLFYNLTPGLCKHVLDLLSTSPKEIQQQQLQKNKEIWNDLYSLRK